MRILGIFSLLLEMGTFVHPCEDCMVFKSSHEKIPKFNSAVFFENKQQVGVMDEIFGPLNEVVSFQAMNRRVFVLFLFSCMRVKALDPLQ